MWFYLFKVRRLGGSYGGKTGPSVHACAVIAICANKLNRPVKIVQDMKSGMETYGKRAPYIIKWKVFDYMTPQIHSSSLSNAFSMSNSSGYLKCALYHSGWSNIG